MRIYEYARLKGLSSREVLEICRHLGWQKTTSSSGLTESEQLELDRQLKKEAATPEESREKPPASPAIQVPEQVQTKPPELKQPAEPAGSNSKPVAGVLPQEPPQQMVGSAVALTGSESLEELSKKLCLSPELLLKKFMTLNVPVNINERPGPQAISLLADHLGIRIVPEKPGPVPSPRKVSALLRPRAPVVTIMGHVDHGKTTILDAIRKSRLAQKEYGQITQRIGAYRVNLPQGSIVFLDTPGHEAFTAMRARGATVTDLVVLVVAADEGVKPQTLEAINHARSAGVPIIVAVNKIDRPNANPDRVRQQLSEHGLVPDSWGGETVFVNVSAITGEGLNDLLEMILLVAEMLELKADPEKLGEGIVIESQLDRARGPVLSVLVKDGTVRLGQSFVAGPAHGRIRALIDDWNRRLSEAGPSTPVEILGADQVVFPGTKFEVVASEREARELAAARKLKPAISRPAVRRLTLEDLYQQVKEGTAKELKIILKADCLGSVEAIRTILERQRSEEVSVSLLHCGAGPITESDILLASASNGIVIGFNVPFGEKSEDLARREGVEVKLYRLIYDLVDDIKRSLEGMLEPEVKEVLLGQALVKKVFTLSRGKVVAGCLVVDGKIVAGSRAKVIRAGKVVYEGEVSSLKRFKDSVREVVSNTECGIEIRDFKEFTEGDIIQSTRMEQVSRTLKKQ